MHVALTPEQEEIGGVVRAFGERVYPAAELLRIAGAGPVPDLPTWGRMARELGLAGIAVTEAHGGFGGRLLDAVVVSAALGRVLAPVPFLSTAVLSAALLGAADGELPASVLEGIAAGTVVVAVARDDAPHAPVAARAETATTASLTGVKRFVVDGAAAGAFLVAAEGEVHLVDAGAPGVDATVVDFHDRTRQLAEVRFTDAPAQHLTFGGEPAADVLERVVVRACVVLAGEQLGAAERCLELAVEYAGDRRQFGRPIGSFQTIKHMCADAAVDIEAARWAVLHAAWMADEQPASVWNAGRAAAVQCAEAAARAARTLVQVLGGIGFTAEHVAHLYLKRAHAASRMLLRPEDHLDALAAALRLQAAEHDLSVAGVA